MESDAQSSGIIDIDFLIEAGADLPEGLSLLIEKLSPFDQAMIVVAYQMMAKVAAGAAPLTGIEQAVEYIGTLKSNLDRAGDPTSFSRELAFLLACLVALSDKYLRIGAASSYDTSEIWRLLLSSVAEISGPMLRVIWGRELGVFASEQTVEEIREATLRFIVPPVYRTLMPEFRRLTEPCSDERDFTHIIA